MQLKLIALCGLIAQLVIASVDAFWLTDSSFFPNSQQQIQLASSLNKHQEVSQASSSPVKFSDNSNFEAIKTQTENNGDSSANKNAQQPPWARVPESSSPPPPLQVATTSESTCQCDLIWLQNQTNHWLNKWLSSSPAADFGSDVSGVQQMRTSLGNVSNSTGTQRKYNTLTGKRRAWDAKQHWHQRQHNASQQHYASSSSSQANRLPTASWHRARSLSSPPPNGHNSARATNNNKSNYEQNTSSPANIERGLQGPKGESGARGERGPSGLISIKDRESLFEPPVDQVTSSNASLSNELSLDSAQKGKQQLESARVGGGPVLAFIESEQVLVLRTNSGWRQVQLLAPLRDPRQSDSTKFNQSPEEPKPGVESQAGISSGAKGMGALPGTPTYNFIKSGGPIKEVNMGQGYSFVSNAAAAAADDAGNKIDIGNDADDEEDEDEEDDDEDEEEDEDDEDVDEEENELFATARFASSELLKKQRAKQLIRQKAPISGRSAAVATLVAATIEDTDTTTVPPARTQQQSKHSSISSTNKQTPDSDRPLKLRIAALNEPFSGNVHGIRGADFECRRNAARANIKGSFKAFLASGFQNLNEVVRSNAHKYSIVNLRGEILSNSWQDLFKQPARFLNPLSRILSFDGRHIATNPNWPNKLVWHGANNQAGYRDLLNNCDGWHSDSLNKFGLATPIHSPKAHYGHLKQSKQAQRLKRFFANQNNSTSDLSVEFGNVLEVIGKYPCRMPLIVLCIETAGQKQQELAAGERSEFETNII